MSGHSKWSTIKRKKGAADAKRGKIFTKLIKEIVIAARAGGGDPNANPRLRTAIQKAKSENMPNDNVDRAIKRGTGELEGVTYDEISYEGYGPGGAAVIVECTTDNKQRTVSEIRHIFNKHHGSLGETNSVAWNFDRKGFFAIPKSAIDEDKLMEVALEAGADDIQTEGEHFEVFCDVADFHSVRVKLEEAKVPVETAELSMIPKNTVLLQGKDAEQMVKLVAAMEDNEDIQNVWSNSDIPDEILAQVAES